MQDLIYKDMVENTKKGINVSNNRCHFYADFHMFNITYKKVPPPKKKICPKSCRILDFFSKELEIV